MILLPQIDDNSFVFKSDYMTTSAYLTQQQKKIKDKLFDLLFKDKNKNGFVFTDIDKFYNFMYDNLISILLGNWYQKIFFKGEEYVDYNETIEKQVSMVCRTISFILTDNYKYNFYKPLEKNEKQKIVFLNSLYHEDIIKKYHKEWGEDIFYVNRQFEKEKRDYSVFNNAKVLEIHKKHISNKIDDKKEKDLVNKIREYYSETY